jgi:maleamate amidohydrolase
MTGRVESHRDGWRALIPQSEWDLYRSAGYGRPLSPGARPALLVVDATVRFVGLDEPQDRSMAAYPASTGCRAWRAVDRAATLLTACRGGSLPVFYTIRDETPSVQAGQPRALKRTEGAEPDDANRIVPPLAPLPGEAVLTKAKPSAFHSTALLSMLVYRGIDTLVIAGGVTSGCVRASAVDAFSYGFRLLVPEDAVFDRSDFAHAWSLFDLQQKYAQVSSATRVGRYLRSLQIGDDASWGLT